jgi:hypothetical protein
VSDDDVRPDPGPEAVTVDRRSQMVLALQRLFSVAREEGLPETSRILTEAIGVLGYEAAGFRIPRCPGCSTPLSDDKKVARINRDRVMPSG